MRMFPRRSGPAASSSASRRGFRTAAAAAARASALACLAILVVGACQSCAALGVAAYKAQAAQSVEPAYKGFVNQTIAVMVWADNAILVDRPTLAIDTARGLQGKMQTAAQTGKVEDLKGTTWIRADQVVRFQEDHPELEGQPATAIATKVPGGITRLIYIEVGDFTTHPNDSVDLFRGSMKGSLKVIEIANGNAKVGHQDEDVSALFPDKCPPEGLPVTNGEEVVYRGTIDAFTTEVYKRFVTHEADAQ